METKIGGCHCGKVRYEVEVDLTQPVIECNCSHCQIKGLMLSFVPKDSFRLTTDEQTLAEYRFNKNVIEHRFCNLCGVEPFGRGKGQDGAEMVAVNVRTIDAIDLSTLTRMPYNGKDF